MKCKRDFNNQTKRKMSDQLKIYDNFYYMDEEEGYLQVQRTGQKSCGLPHKSYYISS